MLTRLVTLLVVFLTAFAASSDAFVVAPRPQLSAQSMATARTTATAQNVFGKKAPKEDLSFIETRDMTREEMLDLNKQNEEIMNMELQMMTGFSFLLSLPILYLCWVAFFSD